VLPFLSGVGPEGTQCMAGDEMALDVALGQEFLHVAVAEGEADI
jgi:hypothetical protein